MSAPRSIPLGPLAAIPQDLPLILASSSPRRRMLMEGAGYRFTVIPPDEKAECGICSRETPPEMVARLAMQKAADVARRVERGMIIGADTVAECLGQILGKPADRDHAAQMLRLLRGRPNSVYSGICLWLRPENRMVVDVVRTRLRMHEITDDLVEMHLDSGKWEGKAGAFGYQDGNDWLDVLEGSESNIVGLPLERLAELVGDFQSISEVVDPNDVKVSGEQ